jgi:hypothetical protein
VTSTVKENTKYFIDCKTDMSSRYDCIQYMGVVVGYTDPVVAYHSAIAQRIKGTLGITGSFVLRVPIDARVWHLDVDSSHPGGAEAPKGSTVRRLKWYVSWVQTAVRQVGLYLLCAFRELRRVVHSTQGPG